MLLIKMDSFGEIIRRLREEKGQPLRTVAAYLDIDQAILSRIERGQRNASRKHVELLAEYFMVEEDDLLTAWLSDKILYELADEQLVLKALQVAEEKVKFRSLMKISHNEIITKIKGTLKNFKSIQKAWIFGSFARKDDSSLSDIDILIDVPNDKVFTLFDIAEVQEQLQKLINRKIDVVMLSAIKSSVKERISAEMKLIYEA
ncbi:MAG: nucleotidyltransferase domain-containing protein [Bacteroidota bacterium]